ncbi:hypothetical protein HpVH116_05580 [Helicobacter pylori]
MNETLKQFQENQKRNQENLKKLLDFIHTGEKYGIKIEESFKAKINSAIQSAADQKLRVALVGGFSEGKTSIAAAWIERLDKSMKIDHQESSDAVKIYDIDNEIELVDTPGLFGSKKRQPVNTIKILPKNMSAKPILFYTRSTRQTPSKKAIRTI